MHLSGTAISARLAKSARFREDLRLCEDFAFFCQCAELARIAIVSDETGVARGVGDNLWHGVDFFDPRTARVKYGMMRLWKDLRRSPRLDAEDRQLLDLRIQSAREHFYWIQARQLRLKKKFDAGMVMRWLLADPKFAMLVAALLLDMHPTGGATAIPGDEA